MERGKTVELFLVNGTAESLIIASLKNWDGCAYKIQRGDIPNCDEDVLKGVGVYFLFGQSDDSGLPTVYIGESEKVKSRLMEHIHNSAKESFDWNTAVCFFGGLLNKAFVRFLERSFVQMARDAGRYEVKTTNTYVTKLSRADESTMNGYIDNAEILINALGYNVLVPQPVSDSKTHLFVARGNKAEAIGFMTGDGFTVQCGSLVSDHTVPSLKSNNPGVLRLRETLESNGTIRDRRFTRDFEFSSPSCASRLVLGRPSNGRDDWVDAGKLTLGEYMKTL